MTPHSLMIAACSSKIAVFIYKTIQCHNPEDHTQSEQSPLQKLIKLYHKIVYTDDADL
jgi:hypothetical protein